MGMELRSTLESKLGVEIPVASLFDDPTVMSLARVAGELFDGANARRESSARITLADEEAKPASEPRRNRLWWPWAVPTETTRRCSASIRLAAIFVATTVLPERCGLGRFSVFARTACMPVRVPIKPWTR